MVAVLTRESPAAPTLEEAYAECRRVVRGETEEEVLKNAQEHAKEHGFKEVTPELIAMIKSNIREE